MLDPPASSCGHLYLVSGKLRAGPAGTAEFHGTVASGLWNLHKVIPISLLISVIRATQMKGTESPEIHGDI